MPENPHRRIGKGMYFFAWALGLLILSRLFADWQRDKENPNQALQSQQQGQAVSVTLEANRNNHYRFIGRINGQRADFVVDTGATEVVVPSEMAERFQMKPIGESVGLTANGYVQLQRSIIKELSIGEITLYNVRASINPGMKAQQPILLGMSALSQLDMEQKQGFLRLTQYQP